MAGREPRRKKLNWVARAIALAAIIFLVLISVQEKHGLDLGLPKMFKLDFMDSLLGDISAAVSPDAAAETGGDLETAALRVHYIDVGQGKAILIEAPEKNVLIDAGENDQGQKLLRYFSARKIDRLDIVIGTHPHSDHIGGLDTVIDGMSVGKVILPALPDALVPATRTYTDLLKTIAKEKLKITPARPGDKYDLGGGAVLTILGPLKDYEDLNSMSVVSRLDYGKTSFLFTGDAMSYAERDMLDAETKMRATVLDSPHHGSQTSNTKKFIQAVNPHIAVISCGIDNSYGHPHREVVERYTGQDIEMLRTDLNGTVVISSDGETLGAETEK